MLVNRLSEVMGKRRMKVAGLAAASGLARNTITALYYDRAKMISFATLERLCTALECQPGELFEVQCPTPAVKQEKEQW